MFDMKKKTSLLLHIWVRDLYPLLTYYTPVVCVCVCVCVTERERERELFTSDLLLQRNMLIYTASKRGSQTHMHTHTHTHTHT